MIKVDESVNNERIKCCLLADTSVYTTRLEDMTALKNRNIQNIKGKITINKIIKESKPIAKHKQNQERTDSISKIIRECKPISVNKRIFEENNKISSIPKESKLIPIDTQNGTKKKIPALQKKSKVKVTMKRPRKLKKTDKLTTDLYQDKKLTIIFYYTKYFDIDVYVFDKQKVLQAHFNKPYKEMNRLVNLYNSNKEIVFTFRICCWFTRNKTVETLERIFSINLKFLIKNHQCRINKCTCCCRSVDVKEVTSNYNWQENLTEQDPSAMTSQVSIIIQQLLTKFEGLRLDTVNGVVRITADNASLNKLTESDEKILKQILVYAQNYVDQCKNASNINMSNILSTPNKALDTNLLPYLNSNLNQQVSNQPICQIANLFSLNNNIQPKTENQMVPDPPIVLDDDDDADIETTIPTTYIENSARHFNIIENNVAVNSNVHVVHLMSDDMQPTKKTNLQTSQVYPNFISEINNHTVTLNAQLGDNNFVSNNELLTSVNETNSMLPVEVIDSDPEEEFILGV